MPNTPKADITDYFEAGHTVEEFKNLIKTGDDTESICAEVQQDQKKQISDQKHLHRERMRLQKGVFSSLANAVGNIGELYADFVQSDEVRNSMKATADKAIECMDNIKELNELEEQLKAEEQESEDED